MFFKTNLVSCLLLRNLKIIITKRSASSLDGKMMNKVMGLNRKSKKVWYKSNVGANPSFEELMKQTTNKDAGRQAPKRVKVLNKLLMKYITDLMSTGEYSDKFIGYGLEITKVCISGDYRSVNVYWMANKSEDDSFLDELLQNTSGLLRHELSRLKIMGEVPKLQFIKDKTYANISAVERLLNKADFGEDFVPTHSTLLKNHPTIFITIDPEISTKIVELESKENFEDDQEDIIPEMKMDVMGLDYSAIITRLNVAIQKSKAVHRISNTEKNKVKTIKTECNEQSQYLSFTDFVKKRKIQEAKSIGRRRSRLIEKEMYYNDVSFQYDDDEENTKIDEYPLKI